MNHLFAKDLDAVIDKCNQTLTNSLRHVKDDTGWHQHLGTHKIGIVATAMAMRYYKMLDQPCPDLDEVRSFLIKRQKDDGGWPYISNTHGESNVESTCWAILALHEYPTEYTPAVIEKGVNWLLSQHENSDIEDKGWPFAECSTSRVYITAFVLRTLNKIGFTDSQEFEASKQWLLNAQNLDGGWGELADKGSSIFYTSYVIITLLECRADRSDLAIKKAEWWLDNRLKELDIRDASLLCYLEFIERGTGKDRIRIPFFHYVLPYVVQAYIKLGRRTATVCKALYVIMERSKDGVIEHPMLENSKIVPIWALFDSVSAINLFKQSFNDWSKVYEIFYCGTMVDWYIKKNPMRFFLRYYFYILGIPMTGMFVYIFLHVIENYKQQIIDYWNSLSDSSTGQFQISFYASCAFAFIAFALNMIKKVFHFNTKHI